MTHLQSPQGLKAALFHTFQATTAFGHDMREKGLNYMITIAKENGFEAIAVQYIAVMPSESKVTVKSPVGLRGKLAMFALSIPNCYPQGT